MRRDYNTTHPTTPLRRSLIQRIFYFTCHCLLVLVMSLLFRARCHGARNVPKSGPVLLVANHQSYLDPPLIGLGIWQRQLHYVARQGLFTIPWLAPIIRALNAIPIPEDGPNLAAIKEILRRLKAGHAVLIFPEGSRTPDGAMHPFKRGTSLLVEKAACPVVPVALEGCYDVWPRAARGPRPFHGRIAVKYGMPITHEQLMKHGADSGLQCLAHAIDALRLELRAELRTQSRNRFPPPGSADNPSFPPPTTPPTPSIPTTPETTNGSRGA